jgi:hypothetical protein
VRKPPYVRSGREVTVAQKAFQRTFGMRMRGKIGSGPLLGPVGDLIAKATGAQVFTDIPLRTEEQPAFGDRDVMSQLFVLSRQVDEDGARKERMLEEAFRDMRKAIDLINSDDPEEQRVGRVIFDESMEQYEKDLEPYVALHGIEFERARTDQEKFQFLDRVLKTQDFDRQFDKISLSRRAFIAVGSAIDNVNETEVKNMIRRIRVQDSGQLRTHTSLAQIQYAHALVLDHIQRPLSSVALPEFRELERQLRVFTLPKAEAEFREERFTNEVYRRIAEDYINDG